MEFGGNNGIAGFFDGIRVERTGKADTNFTN
jgi:hypothetical protein